jgi:DNA ligase-1
MRLIDLSDTSEALAATRSRRQKTEILAACLRKAGPAEAAVSCSLLMGQVRQGKLGVGGRLLQAIDAPPAQQSGLALADVETVFDRLAACAGAGSKRQRGELLAGLYARATGPEQRFLTRLLLGELRQGALEGLMADAVAVAAEIEPAQVRRAAMFSGDLSRVAESALRAGTEGLATFGLQLFQPLRPMLAQPAESLDAALAGGDAMALEYKLDGARVQLHKLDDRVRVFTRHLNDVTDSVPELVEAARSLPAARVVLDGEAIALDAGQRPQPFQVTMRRFGRRQDVAAMRETIPLSARWFDCLHLDGRDLIDLPANQRFEALSQTLPAGQRVPRILTGDADAAAAFLQRAIGDGHEGIMAKALHAAYQAGSRGADWLKLKPVHTLDLVVLAAEWGSGRRRGWLSNLHLAARDADTGAFVMLGKTFKGLNDATLAWQTGQLLARETGREGGVVHVRPELVVEVAFNELQRSRQYPAGLALRFARVRRYREDKPATEADTLTNVRMIFERGLAGAALR